MIKRLYNWVLSWSESKWGWLALLFIALFEASWFPLPPDILLIALCIGATKKSFRFATICLIGSVLGAMLGYYIGSALWGTPSEPSAIAEFCYEYIFSRQTFTEVSQYYDKYNFWIVFTAGFTPLPFKVFTIAGGMSHINFPMFVLASAISRGLRFFLIAWLIWKFGAPIKKFIDKYFNLLATLLVVMLVGISAAIIGIFGDEETTTKSAANETTTIEQRDTTQPLNENTPCDTLDYSDAH